MNRRHSIHILILGAGVAAALWLAGIIVFTAHVKTLNEPQILSDLEPTDAIVVLTGGSERLNVGFELLDAGKAKKLFISGVHPGLTLDQIMNAPRAKERLYVDRVALGHDAESTMGNAEETLAWMKLEGYKSLRLVTANYHMPRSLFIFHSAMPEIAIIPHPIAPDHVVLDEWWQHPGTANLLVTEYNKYLWAAFRIELGAP